MARIILKCPYHKGGEKTAAHLSNLVKYIATRDGVEKMDSGHKLWHSTKKQKDLIAQILREFPDAKELFEYEDYLENPNRGNASEFITIALEQHLDKISAPVSKSLTDMAYSQRVTSRWFYHRSLMK